MEKNLVLKLKGSIINNTAERLGYINGIFCSSSKSVTSEILLPRLQFKKTTDTVTFRKLSGDITFYKGSSFDNLTEIKEDTVELTSNISDNSLCIKGTTDVFYMKPNVGSRIEIGPASNILSFGTTANDWAPVCQFLVNSKLTSSSINLLVESSNLLECEYLSKINIGMVVNITDVSDITELNLDNFQGKIITTESEVELNKLLNENTLKKQTLGEIYIATIDDKNVVKLKEDAIFKINLTGHNYNTDFFQFNNAKVSYSGTEEDYPFKSSSKVLRSITFNGDGTNFDTFFKALTKYNTISQLVVTNVIITDASNSAIEQLKTKVTGIFRINGVDKKA